MSGYTLLNVKAISAMPKKRLLLNALNPCLWSDGLVVTLVNQIT